MNRTKIGCTEINSDTKIYYYIRTENESGCPYNYGITQDKETVLKSWEIEKQTGCDAHLYIAIIEDDELIDDEVIDSFVLEEN